MTVDVGIVFVSDNAGTVDKVINEIRNIVLDTPSAELLNPDIEML